MSGVLETEKEILQELLHLDSSDEEEDNILEEDSGDEDYNSDADQEYFLDRPSGVLEEYENEILENIENFE
ncbi:hypothetical protein LSTR_LSTR016229, partial [Laodelphax striatellus]